MPKIKWYRRLVPHRHTSVPHLYRKPNSRSLWGRHCACIKMAESAIPQSIDALLNLEKEHSSDYPNDRILIIRVKVWIGDPNNTRCDGDVVVDAMAIEGLYV